MSRNDDIADLRALAAIAQVGLRYASDDYDRQRYAEVRAIVARLLASHADRRAEEVAAVLRLDEGYPTPKIEVRAGVFRGDAVLLVRESADGLWSLPGGWADIGLTLRENVCKEVREETGLAVEVGELSFVHDRRLHNFRPHQYFHIYKFFFRCREIDRAEAFAPSREVLACDWFPVDALPPLSEERVSAAQIAALHARGDAPGAAWLD